MRQYNVDVLGTPYTVKVLPQNEDAKLKDCDGYCDKTTKTCVVLDTATAESCNLGDPEWYTKKTIRHELVHAFRYEAGLAENWAHKDYGQEETTVDWIANITPKMFKAFQQADAL